MRYFRLSTAGLVLALLVACASQPMAPQIAATTDVDEFELTGRVAVNLDGRGYSARLKWQHEVASDAMWLYSPIGSTVATLNVNGEMATLVTSKKERFSSDNVQALTREVLGWDLPLNGLQHWVLGRGDPREPVLLLEHDAQMRIKRLAQGDWHIDYLGYAEGSALPSSMALRYADLRMRLIIDSWKLPSRAR